MTKFWRLASGLAVFLMTPFASVSLVLNLALGDPPLPGFTYHGLLPILALAVIIFAFAGSYFLINDARKAT